ncbi:ERIC3 protein, partial [Alaudala cheleensis]|nr:ERIC3 protein [Alaudala cheleensis]
RFLETYNSLTDKHLVGYFSNARIRRHLQKSGLISRSGRIIPEKEYRLKAMGRDHHRHVLDCLADAISHKILDMEDRSRNCCTDISQCPVMGFLFLLHWQRHHQLERKRRLENSLSRDKMQPIKLEQITGSVEEIIHVHCPHPPLVPRSHHVLCPLVAAERAGRSHWRTPGLGVDCCGGCCHHHHHRIREPASSK